jgi:CRISPR-associated endonuclease Csy4
MDRYLDIQILPDPEFKTSVIMNATFGKLHNILVDFGSREIGVSFPMAPQTRTSLGDLLRIHGPNGSLEHLMEKSWLAGVRDHVRVGPIERIKEITQHYRVRRVQPKSNVERLRRRYVKRHEVSAEEAARLIPDNVEQQVDLPFLQLKSKSTGQNFRLFIEQSGPQDGAIAGEFNSYGLSLTATVPWF